MSNERKLWFVTRAWRDPAFHIDALRALNESVGEFPAKWYGEREVQKNYEKVLGEKEYKRDNVSRSGSGGRTWVAVLRMYNYVYMMDGYLHLTKVGEKLIKGENIRENNTKQILNLQIPNDYFLSSQFKRKFEEGFEIRPARFLVRLILKAELSHFITKEEITYFCLPVKRDNDLEAVKDKILRFRAATKEDREEMKQEIAEEYDNRERSDHTQRDYEASHSDVANTFMIMIDYTGLATYIRGQDLRITPEQKSHTESVIAEYDSRYPFNQRYKLSLEAYAVNAGLDITTYKANPYYQIGPATRNAKNLRKANELLAKYPVLGTLSENEIRDILHEELSITVSEKLATELSTVKTEVINQDFFDNYLDEADNYRFEDKTGEIIRAFGFKVDMRPSPTSHHRKTDKTEIEILIHLDDSTVAIIDAKNYKKYRLTQNDANYMATEYIPIYQEYGGKKVRNFGYVTSNKFTGTDKLSWIKELAEKNPQNVPVDGMMIDAKTLLSLLDYCLSNNYSSEQKNKVFLSLFTNSGYSSLLRIDL